MAAISKYKPQIGLVAGLIIAAVIWRLPFEGLSAEGQKCLALSLFAVTWWAAGVVHPGYTSLLLLVGFVLFKVAPAENVFSVWSSPLIYLIVGSFLIAAAVQESGLGLRIAYRFILKYVESFRSVIISAYILGFLLSFFIPHPWPRSFLIMSVMRIIIKSAGLPKRDAANIGLAVFGGSVPTSTILLTADSSVNVLIPELSGQNISWIEWLIFMGVPGITATILTCILQLWLFKSSVNFSLDKELIRQRLQDMSPLKAIEKRTLFWVLTAILLWATDSIHHLHIGWVAVIVAVGLSLPTIGAVLKPASWAQVSLGTLFFVSAAQAIGRVGTITGLNSWIAQTVLPADVPANPFLFAALITVIAIAVHMVLGSVVSALVILGPAFSQYASAIGWNPLFPCLLVYIAVVIHWIFPYQHMNILIGLGEEGGGYSEAEAIRLGLPLTAIIFIVTVFVAVPWWKLTGLI